jgi:catechol-2,3-dioxygenase
MIVNFDALLGLVKPLTKLAHVVLRTNNFKTIVDYYCVFLSAYVIYENDILAFLSYNDEHHCIAIVAVLGTEAKHASSCGLEHIAFTLNSLLDLLLTYRQRKNHRILPDWPVNHGPTTSIYYKDLDGNQIET